jgi:ribonuclease P protein component
MIARNHRFHGYNSLRFVYAHGKTVRSSMLALRVAPNAKRSSYRCAVVVSKKISKSAVVRNRIRRRVYEQMRLLNPQQQPSLDIVVTIYTDQVATVPTSELQKSLSGLLEQAVQAISPQE